MELLAKIGVIVFVALLGGIVAGVICGLPVMWLWNWLMPVLFHLPRITFLQALGLVILVHLLFPSSSSK